MKNPRHPQHLVILVALLPFLVAFSAAILVAGLQFEVPRQLVPGEGLAFLGLAISCGMGVASWCGLRLVDKRRAYRSLGLVATGLAVFIGAPAWALEVLPTINGLRLEPSLRTPMAVAPGQVTLKEAAYPFVLLAPLPLDRELPGGRYFLRGGDSARLPAVMEVTHANGLLGARVVLAVTPYQRADL